jgi:hypothetical protein
MVRRIFQLVVIEFFAVVEFRVELLKFFRRASTLNCFMQL